MVMEQVPEDRCGGKGNLMTQNIKIWKKCMELFQDLKH